MYQVESDRSAHEVSLSRMKEVQDRETSVHTLKNRANKCKTCWGKTTVTFYKSTRYPIFKIGQSNGKTIYNVNPETVKCSCQH